MSRERPRVIGGATAENGASLVIFEDEGLTSGAAFDEEGCGPYVLIVGCPNCHKHAGEWWDPFSYVGALNSGRDPNEPCSRVCRYQLEWQTELAARRLQAQEETP